MNRFLTTIFFVFTLLLPLWQAHTTPQRVEHVTTQLVSPNKAIAPGEPFWVGWKLKMDPHWHVYWKNPGDSGLPPQIDWRLPDGFKPSNMHWPAPQKINVPPLVNYGYEDDVTLYTRITPPQNLQPNQEIDLRASVSFLMCKDICLPGEATLSLPLKVGEKATFNSRIQDDFERTQKRWPENGNDKINVISNGEKFRITLADENLGSDVEKIEIYPTEEEIIVDASLQLFQRHENGYSVTVTKDTYFNKDVPVFEGLAIVHFADGRQSAYHFERPVKTGAIASLKQKQPAPSATAVPTVWVILLLAFVAGLILNLMPCVLPVLSLKLMSMMKHAHGKSTFANALAYTGGILATFCALALAIQSLKAAGHSLGWGFHLQEPSFVALLAVLLTLMSLNFFGVFEAGHIFSRLGGRKEASNGLAASFLSGMLVTIVATPCTVPFMGTAVAYALAQPFAVTLGVFMAMGVGLAFPFILVGTCPGMVRWLPKPGAWMETFKQLLGFPLLATVFWLWWVYSQQVISTQALALAATLFMLAIGTFAFGKLATLNSSAKRKRWGWAIFMLTLAWTSWVSLKPASQQTDILFEWQPWSPQNVHTARQAGLPVLVNFTADWCVTCKVNERVAFGDKDVQKALLQNNVQLFMGDWTRRNAAISKRLADFNRSGVPLYLYYPAGGEASVLPQILTPATLLGALAK